MHVSDDLTAMTGRRKTGPAAVLLLALLAVAGCAGIEPYKARNHREEGPAKGLLTGAEGEFVIFRYEGAPESEEEPESGTAESNPANPE